MISVVTIIEWNRKKKWIYTKPPTPSNIRPRVFLGSKKRPRVFVGSKKRPRVFILMLGVKETPEGQFGFSRFICLPACWLPKSLPLLVSLLHLSPCMLIPKISLLHLSPFLCLPACWFPKSPPLQLSPFICLPACWFPKSPFFICLPSFVSLHADSQSPCMLITEIAAAPSLPSSFVSLHSPDSWKL